MIHVGAILKALGWQAVGAGMLTKYAIDQASERKMYRSRNEYYKPMDDWWKLHGCDPGEAYTKTLQACKLDVHYDWIDYVCRTITPDNAYIEEMLRHHEWPKYRNHGEPMTMLYYALHGRAMQLNKPTTDDFGKIRNFPSLDVFGRQDKPVQDLVIKLMNEHGVTDLFWYTHGYKDIMRRLNELSRQ